MKGCRMKRPKTNGELYKEKYGTEYSEDCTCKDKHNCTCEAGQRILRIALRNIIPHC